jgi:hypothetical protein
MGALKEPPRLIDEELPEARVPTNLVRNQVHILGDQPHHPALFDVGPYRVLRGLVRAPQAWLVEATGPAGDRAILHLVHCRAVRSRAEELERQAFHSQIASATVGLFDEENFTVQAHGHVQREDGTRVLFWALPWHDGALQLDDPGAPIRDVAHLLEIAIALSDRLGRRHDLERLDPLLSEQLVAVTRSSADLLGVPIFIPPSWLAPEMPSCRMAPEEMGNLLPTRIGDIWRLGQTLTALAARFDAIPSALSNLLRWMTHDDPKKRPPRAVEVRVECATIKGRLGRVPNTKPPPGVQRPSLSFEEVSQLIMVTLGPTSEVDLNQVRNQIQVLQGQDEVTLAGSVNIKGLERPPAPTGVPPWAFFFSAHEYERFIAVVKADLARRGLAHRLGTGVVQLIAADGAELEYLGLSDVARACFRADPDTWESLITADFESQIGESAVTADERPHHDEPTQRIQEPKDEAVTEPPIPEQRVKISVGDAVDLHAIVEKNETIPDRAPEPPMDQIPFLETLPSPTHPARVPDDLREQAQANLHLPKTGTLYSPGALPPNQVAKALAFPRPIVPKGLTLPARSDAPLVYVPPHEPRHPEPRHPAPVHAQAPLIEGKGTLDPSMARAAGGAGIRNLMLAFVLILTIGAIVGAIIFAERPRGEAERQFSAITLDGEIVLRANPPNAVVVGETDGRILGQAPLRFLLAQRSEVAVIVASPGRDPRRVALGGAGEITVDLSPLPSTDANCSVPFEGVRAADLGGVIGNMNVADGKLEFAGASVVRTKPGSKQSGAWIVRCGSDETIRLEPRPIAPAELKITKPESAVAYVEGQALGMIPVSLTVPEAFTKIAIDTGRGARGPIWVPVRGPTEVSLQSVPEDLVREIKEERPRK